MATFFLYTFLVGFGLTIVSVVLGALDLGGDHGTHHGGDLAHSGDAGHGGDLGHGADHSHVYGKAQAVSPINMQTIVAFLLGFGGAGYMTTRFGLLGLILALPLAIGGGMGTGWLAYRWMKFLVKGERPLAPISYVGLVGRLTLGIREGGTGELVYVHDQTRSVLAARSHDGKPLAKGEEVVVLRYEKGVAYVQPFSEFVAREQEQGGAG